LKKKLRGGTLGRKGFQEMDTPQFCQVIRLTLSELASNGAEWANEAAG
jgi:hypothetical protein